MNVMEEKTYEKNFRKSLLSNSAEYPNSITEVNINLEKNKLQKIFQSNFENLNTKVDKNILLLFILMFKVD